MDGDLPRTLPIQFAPALEHRQAVGAVCDHCHKPAWLQDTVGWYKSPEKGEIQTGHYTCFLEVQGMSPPPSAPQRPLKPAQPGSNGNGAHSHVFQATSQVITKAREEGVRPSRTAFTDSVGKLVSGMKPTKPPRQGYRLPVMAGAT